MKVALNSATFLSALSHFLTGIWGASLGYCVNIWKLCSHQCFVFNAIIGIFLRVLIPVGIEYRNIDPRSINLSIPTDYSIFSLKAPYFVGGKETGLTCGLMDDLCSIMINNAATWRMTSIWGLTALTFATPLLVKVIVTVAQWCRWLKLEILNNVYEYFLMCRLCLSELNPPDGKMRDALLQIVCRDGRVISLCADGADDALWDNRHTHPFIISNLWIILASFFLFL